MCAPIAPQLFTHPGRLDKYLYLFIICSVYTFSIRSNFRFFHHDYHCHIIFVKIFCLFLFLLSFHDFFSLYFLHVIAVSFKKFPVFFLNPITFMNAYDLITPGFIYIIGLLYAKNYFIRYSDINKIHFVF